ncbi:hypothetical protein NKH77_38925 [Streptomyces sp. M19]
MKITYEAYWYDRDTDDENVDWVRGCTAPCTRGPAECPSRTR